MRDCKCGHGWADHWLHNKGDAANCDVYPACTCTQYRPASEPRKSWQEQYCERYTAKLKEWASIRFTIQLPSDIAPWDVQARQADDDTTEAYPI